MIDLFGRKDLLNQVRLIVNQRTIEFRDLMSGLLSSGTGKRDIYSVYDYPRRYTYARGYQAIARQGLANRICVGVPRSCWRNGFNVIEPKTGEEDATILLEDETQKLKDLDLFGRLERADVMNRIGNFAVLLVGVPDGRDLREPLGTVQGNGFDALYFRPFGYDGIQISDYDTDSFSPRYGMPERYQVQVMSYGRENKSARPEALLVHHSRIVHIVENPLDNEVEGICALEPVYNRILDWEKLVGGSAEAYFRNARGKTVVEIQPETSASLLNDPEKKRQFDEAVKEFTDSWKDQIVTTGKAYTLDTPHYQAKDSATALLWEISAHTGIRMRILTGEGAGQLAGSEDRISYNAMINDRQTAKCSLWARGVLDILATAGMLELPETYDIQWPVDEPLNVVERAELAQTRANTLKTLTEASSSIGGDAIDLDSALDYFGMDEIQTDDEFGGDLDGRSDPSADNPDSNLD